MDHWAFNTNITNTSQSNAQNAYAHIQKQPSALVNNPVVAQGNKPYTTVEPPKNVSLEDVFKKKNLAPSPQWNSNIDPQFKNFVNQTPHCKNDNHHTHNTKSNLAIQLPGPNGKPYPITVNTKPPNNGPYWNQKYLPFPTEKTEPAKIMSNIYTKPSDVKTPMTIEQLKLLQQQQQQQQMMKPTVIPSQQQQQGVILTGNGSMYNNRPRAIPTTPTPTPSLPPPSIPKEDPKKRKLEDDSDNLYKKRFLQIASGDKQQILRPDYVNAFSSYEDVFARLQPFYRILDFNENSQERGINIDEEIVGKIEKLKENFKEKLNGKFAENVEKIALEKLFLIEEKVRLDALKASLTKIPPVGTTFPANSRLVNSSGTPMIYMSNTTIPVKKVTPPPPPKILPQQPPVNSMEALFKKEPIKPAPMLSFDDEESLFEGNFDPSFFMLNVGNPT